MIWQMEQFAGGAISVICTSMLKKGKQDENNLREAADWLFQHNDVLRTRIRAIGSDVTQYVCPNECGEIPVLHFDEMGELTAYAEQYAKIPLDLQGALCEIKVLLLPDRYGLLVKVHHLIADAWTMALLATQFNMLIKGETPLCGSYQNYFEREQSYLNSKRYLQDKRYFLNLIQDNQEPVLLSDQHADNLAAQRKCFVIPQNVAARIREFTQQENISVFAVFSGVLACYISRIHENAEQVFLGTTVLNRVDEQEMRTAGMYVNTVPLLVTPGKSESFQECLEKTEDMLMSIFRHQRYNYTLLQKDAAKELSFTGRLYDVTVHYVNAAVANSQPEAVYLWHHNGIQTESLQVHIDDRNSEGIFRVTYDYQTAKFSAEEIEKLHAHLINLLLDGIDNPQKECHRLCLLSAEEERRLRFEFNDTAKAYPISETATISSLFEENAEKNSEKLCVLMDGQGITYGEFLRRTRNIDTEIRKITNSAKSVVAVIAQRSVQMYCALYGIIRGGNAYLPILPETPKERIQYMLKSSGASVVVAERAFAHLVEDVPCMDLEAMLAGTDSSAPIAASPRDTAYVMFTSGSTGMPKGVKISHQSVINRILWMNDTYPLEDNGVILQKTVYGFDVSVWEIFWWGMCGGAMAVSLPGEHAVPAKIMNEISRNRVTHLHFVPSVFELFLNYLESREQERNRFRSVKHVFLSGEKLEAALVNRFYRMFDYKKVKLHNLYGPTECTVDVTYYDCVPGESVIPIGKPIHNTQIYIMDQNLNLLPPGIKGELVVGGQNVGDGYINDPELTQERFVENPFGEGRLYRTGDVAYIREDGQVIFCDRRDFQVKINGQRVELAEIEAVIKKIPGVDTAAVVVQEEAGRKQLIAYYCGCGLTAEVIRSECEKRLPTHMIPRAVQLDSLPLHPNGKLNRKELEQKQTVMTEAEQPELPVNETEQHICDVFCSILGKTTIGRNSDFFALGGDSLAAISFLAESGYDQITAAQFMGNPTPAKLAKLIMGEQKAGMQFVQTIYKPETVSRAYVLFPFAGGDAQTYVNLVRSIKQIDHRVALYYVPYLHRFSDCAMAAEEIVALTKESSVSFYSHCAGSAVALCILQRIEQQYGNLISHYYAAGNIPVRTGCAFNGWNCVPDKLLLQILKKSGAPDTLLLREIAKDVLEQFRTDTDFYADYFSQKPEKYSCRTTLLLGRKDLFTRFVKNPEKHWSRYARNLEQICCIETHNHYFHSQESDLTAQIILSK